MIKSFVIKYDFIFLRTKNVTDPRKFSKKHNSISVTKNSNLVTLGSVSVEVLLQFLFKYTNRVSLSVTGHPLACINDQTISLRRNDSQISVKTKRKLIDIVINDSR